MTRRSNRRSARSQASKTSKKDQYFEALGLKKRASEVENEMSSTVAPLESFQPVSGVTFQRVICGGTYASYPSICGKSVKYLNCAGETAEVSKISIKTEKPI